MLALVVAGAGLLTAVGGPSQEDEEARKAFRALTRSQRREVVQRFATEAAALDTLQNRVLRQALSLAADGTKFPAARPHPYYDPQRHAPELPIARKRLKESGRLATRVREEMFEHTGGRRLRTAHEYDWATRQVVRTADPEDPGFLFENGLAGHPPFADLAEALVEAHLDDGRHEKELTAFGHAYTDRDGGVYPLTLYDAWCSGQTLEMPDVDALGLVHDLLDDWTTWVSPVPEPQQKPLYRRIYQLFEAPHRYRALRTALARAYVTGAADMRDGYGPRLDHLHGFWHRHQNSLERGRGALPGPEDEEWFIADWGLEVEEDEALRAAAAQRHLDLERDARALRKRLLRILGEVAAEAEALEEDPAEEG